MEKVEEIIVEDNQQKNVVKSKEKKQIKLFGYSIWRILAYFIIYSVIGYIIETLFGIVTKGVWESRQSFLYGPFCAIYGLGAVVMILSLQYFNKNNNTLFFGGFIVGSIVEYVVSLFGEIILNVKWWDYSDMPLNINGRVCVYFSLFWGFLAIYLMSYANPRVDRLINWMKSKFSLKFLKTTVVFSIIFLFVDCVITGYALKMFFLRMVKENDINIGDKQVIEQAYEDIYGNEKLSNFIHKFWGNKKMIRTFPNLKLEDNDGNIIHLNSYLTDIQPYYIKFRDKN